MVLACAMDKEGWNVFEKWGNWPSVGHEVYDSLYQLMCSGAVMKCWNSDGFCLCRATVWRLLNFWVGAGTVWLVVRPVGGAGPVFLGSTFDLGVPLLSNATCTRLSAFLWWQAFISSLLGVQLLIKLALLKSPLDVQEQWTRLASSKAFIVGSTGQVGGGNLSTRVEAFLDFIGDKTKHIRGKTNIR